MFIDQATKPASLGIAVVPTYKGLRHPALTNWQEMATTNGATIAKWANNGYRDFNCVCVAKQEGTGILDIDDLAACKAAGMPPVPQTFTVKSPKGYHVHFLHTDASRALGNRDIKVDGAKILEVKGHNTAVAAPGCVREDGKQYLIHRDLPLAPLPQEWIDWLREHSRSAKRGTGHLRKFHPDFDAEELFRHYEWEFAAEFEKDGAMYYVFAECPLAERTHEDQIRSKKTCLIIGRTVGFDCKSCGEEHNYGDLITKMEEKGYEKFPGYIFEDEDDAILLQDVDDCDAKVLTAEELAAALGATLEQELPPADTTGFLYLPNDTGNGERLVRKYGNMIRFASGKWYVWNGKRWAPDHYRKLDRMAEYVVKELLAEAEDISDEKERKAKQRFALACGDRSRRAAMVELAATKRGVLKRPTDFDIDLWAFNVQNGTVDLNTGELQPHNPLDNITKISPVIYDAEADCPLWDKFMREVMCGNQEMVDFLAAAAGYSLTGDTRIQAMFFNHGDGENGKGVFLETLAYIIGEYSYTSAFDTFVYHEKSNRDVRNDLAALVGVRFLCAEESSEGHRLDEALIKQLTGENTVTTRFLYQDEFSYKPNFKIWMSSNFRPSIRTTDWGTWRRVKMIPWNFRVHANHRDEQLKSKLRREAPGILNWMLRGLQRYVDAGYKMTYPEIVEKATSEYRISQDIVGQFINTKCELAGKIQVSDLYSSFKFWAEQSRERHNLTLRKFGDEVVKREGIFRNKEKDATYFHGVSLRLSAADQQLNELAEEI
ncbi:MAG: bifunctional DNA primase/polymerase [Acidobacteriia bacterium]|nr:bifunctional DNA primase/polymerase [Terriglobia bacterium]